jgi:hypothetical protein
MKRNLKKINKAREIMGTNPRLKRHYFQEKGDYVVTGKKIPRSVGL